MAELKVLRCRGCSAPLQTNNSVCSYCGSENIDFSGKQIEKFFDIKLINTGTKIIHVIKLIREIITHIGLKEAKDLADNVPSIIKQNITQIEAEEIKKKFESIGASIEIINSATQTLEYQSLIEESNLQSKEEIGKFVDNMVGIGCTFIFFIFLFIILLNQC